MSGKPPFDAVVQAHGPTVFRVCRALVGDVDADDAWSETFLSALRAYPSLDHDANLEAWLVTIAHRRSIDLSRARSRRAAPTDTMVDRPAQSIPVDTDDDLLDALSVLPDKQRRCVVYHYLGGLPYTAVAEILGGTAEAARRSAADGIAALRRSSYALERGRTTPITKSTTNTTRNPNNPNTKYLNAPTDAPAPATSESVKTPRNARPKRSAEKNGNTDEHSHA